MLPKEANLYGVTHTVVEADGRILFSERDCAWGCPSRIAFEKRIGGWYVSIESHDDFTMVSHVLKAWAIVEAAQGSDFHRNKESIIDAR